MRIEDNIKLDFNDVLLKPKRSTISSRSEVELRREFHFKYSSLTWRGIPIISSNMPSVTNETVRRIMTDEGMLTGWPKGMKIPVAQHGYSTITTFGFNESYFTPFTSFVCLDVANGYMEKFVDRIKYIRNESEDKILIAGNVVTAEMTEALILAGADIVKVGIGSGSACATRMITGVGYPQLSAIIECADAAHGLGGHIIADGGCVTPGDVVKAFAAGADFAMLGGMLAGCRENGQDFYGMSSKRANNETSGGLKDYRAAEGLELKLPSRGALNDVLQEIKGGLKSACSYVGAKTLKDLPKCATFVRVNRISNTSLWGHKIENN